MNEESERLRGFEKLKSLSSLIILLLVEDDYLKISDNSID